jgi:hypothetical protein
MGFSQGTRIVGGLLLHQQKRREMGFPKKEGEIEFKFGVLCMGSFAPMVSDLTGRKLISPSVYVWRNNESVLTEIQLQ